MFRKTISHLMAFALTASSANALTYEVLHELQRAGAQPIAPLLAHSDGSFYGTTVSGGAFDGGTLFQIGTLGEVSVLHSFDVNDGTAPVGALAEGDAGVIFGTTSSGGASGFGSAFKITTGGEFTLLSSFTGANGSVPGSLVRALDGNFYGTTLAGGVGGQGTVFKMTAVGVVSTVVNFSGANGAAPVGKLVASGATLYGVTKGGGASGFGSVFRVQTDGSGFVSMVGFNGANGENPSGGLFLNTDGALYGLTEFGGANDFGVAFKLTTAGGFTLLHSFDDPEGSQPVGELARAGDGALYGMTAGGGFDGWGVCFRMTTAGAYNVLGDFSGSRGDLPGSAPRAGLVLAGDGFLYGVTSAGGPGELGTVSKVSPGAGGSVAPLSNFSSVTGWTPSGAPVTDGADFLFPVAFGGSGGAGTLLRFSLSSGELSVAAAFDETTTGGIPDGALIASGGEFFGVNLSGGSSSRGMFYKYTSVDGLTGVSSFATSGGSLCEGGLIAGTDGAFFGVGREGGASGRGTFYRITKTGSRLRLISFTGTGGAAPGQGPRGPVVLAPNGNFYGLTESGGADNAGTIFRMNALGALSIIAEFDADGPRSPGGGLALASDGKIYGTLSGDGAIIRIDPSDDTWSVVASFENGDEPSGEILATSDGKIYGMTSAGGGDGMGTVFRYTLNGGLETLVSFTGNSGPRPGNGSAPGGAGLLHTSGLILSGDGTLYGMTPGGGAGGGGVVFRLAASFDVWRSAFNVNDPLSDTDGDGVPLLVEYGMGGNPVESDAGLLPNIGIEDFGADGKRLAINVTRNPAHDDILIVVEASASLQPGSWDILATSASGAPFSGPGYVSGDASGAGIKAVKIRDIAPLNAASQRFLRVRVELLN